MADHFPLNIVLKQGETYYTDKRTAYIINAIGTNATTDTHLTINNQPTGNIVSLVAPLHATASNILGPLSLGDYFYVVPPDTKFYVEGAAGALFRVIGEVVKLMPGEALSANVAARFANQGSAYLTHVSGSLSPGVNVSLADGSEAEVFSLTPRTIETYTFSSIVEASVANYTPTESQLVYRFYIDNTPLDALFAAPGTIKGGIDILNMPRPPSTTTEIDAFTFEGLPFSVPGDHTLSVRVRNISGASIAPGTGTSLTFNFDAVAVYQRSK